MKYIVTSGFALALLLQFTMPAEAALSNFVCPEAIKGTTPDKRAEIRALLPSGDAMEDPTRLNASIDKLRRLGLSQTLIVDHLIGAYCPTVAENTSLSDSEKTLKVRQFASRITVLVYREEDLSEILLNVPLKPSIVDEVNAKAEASGISVEKWLARAVETALQ
jgi:hypothetical protein